MSKNFPRIMIAAPSGSSGKTTITLGLLAALKKRGLAVQPFKVGVDYIDPQLHAAVTGKHSRNLDSWFMDEKTLTYLFEKNASDINIIEGVCGLFDGGDSISEKGSSAHVANILQTPIILVVNAIGSFRSLAAEVLGFTTFDKEVNIAGVILNNIGSETHYLWTKKLIEKETKVPVIGYLPFDKKFQLPERHLGLIPAQEQLLKKTFINDLVNGVEKYIDVTKLVRIARKAPQLKKVSIPLPKPLAERHVAIAKDKAFNFYYEDNFDLLKSLGATITFFSPLKDTTLPPHTDLVYLGGGFPEFFAKELSKNTLMKKALHLYITSGKKIYAECGGLMYLSQSVEDKQKKKYPMVGALPFGTRWSDRLKISFLQTKAKKNTLLSAKNQLHKGHEFHMFEVDTPTNDIAWDVITHKGRVEGYAKENILASFIHRHFWSNPEMAVNLIQNS